MVVTWLDYSAKICVWCLRWWGGGAPPLQSDVTVQWGNIRQKLQQQIWAGQVPRPSTHQEGNGSVSSPRWLCKKLHSDRGFVFRWSSMLLSRPTAAMTTTVESFVSHPTTSCSTLLLITASHSTLQVSNGEWCLSVMGTVELSRAHHSHLYIALFLQTVKFL